MPDFLTRRHGTWHFVRRVPIEFSRFDKRGVINHSTRIKIIDDRAGRRNARVAQKLNQELEMFWVGLSTGRRGHLNSYEEARQRAKTLGFDYVENDQLLHQPTEARLERLEALIAQRITNDAGARAGLLGTEKKPAFLLSELFSEYEMLTRDEVRDLSPTLDGITLLAPRRLIKKLKNLLEPANLALSLLLMFFESCAKLIGLGGLCHLRQ
jgi:hypothetical protein